MQMVIVETNNAQEARLGRINDMDNPIQVLDMSPQKGRKSAKGRPKSPKPMRSIASFKGSEEFAEWFDRLAKHSRLTASALIEHALVLYAQQEGFKEPAPDR